MLTHDLDVRPLTPRTGALVSGVTLGPDVDDATVAAVRAALLRHRVVFFRDQGHLDASAQQGWARRFGALTRSHPTAGSVAGQERVFPLDARRGGRASHWHTDVTFTDPPPAISVLRAIRTPDVGGDTLWASTVAGYTDLPDALRSTVDRLWARHSNLADPATRYGEDSPERRAYNDRFTSTTFTVEHPVVRVHPETGEPAILLGGHAQHIVGLARQDSDHLFALIQAAVTKPENTVRWTWQPGDVAMWDNRSTQHYAINDYGDFPRLMHRVTVTGETPVGVDGRRSVTIAGDPREYLADE